MDLSSIDMEALEVAVKARACEEAAKEREDARKKAAAKRAAARRRAERARQAKKMAREQGESKPYVRLTRRRLEEIVQRTGTGRGLSAAEREAVAELKGTTLCIKCDQWLDNGDFFSSRKECKDCWRKAFAAGKSFFNKIDTEIEARARTSGLDYDLQPGDTERLFDLQGGLCGYSGLPMEAMSGNLSVRTSYMPPPKNTIQYPLTVREEIQIARTKRRATLKRVNPKRASMDRIDSSKGYTRDNVHLVCYCVNIAKREFTDADFVGMCRAIARAGDARGGATARAPLKDLSPAEADSRPPTPSPEP
jgi:hypothetical protein